MVPKFLEPKHQIPKYMYRNQMRRINGASTFKLRKNHSIFTNDLTLLMGVHMWFIDDLRYK